MLSYEFLIAHPLLLTLLGAEACLIIARSSDLQVVAKRSRQRTAEEQLRCRRGLLREMLMQLIVFVPLSAVVMFLILPPLIAERMTFLTRSPQGTVAVHVMLGIASYGFPLVAFREALVRIAANTLREFATIRPAGGGQPPRGGRNTK